ncbi:DUF4411 family protein [Macrococcus capreoli]
MVKYLLDSNIYLNFYDRYYLVQHFPSFWEYMKPVFQNDVIVPRVIVSENYQNPWLKDFLVNDCQIEIIDHRQYISEWSTVINHIHKSSFYSDKALYSDKGWAHEKIADPWIIGMAKKENYIIVTAESRNNGLNTKNPSGSCKIPDVCEQLGVTCIDMLEFFNSIQLSI